MKVQQYRLDELAHLVKGELIGEGSLQFSNLASLENAEVNHLTFVNGEKHLDQAKVSRAGAYIVTAALKEHLPEKDNFIIVDNPYLAFAILTHVFDKKISSTGIESTAQIHPSAVISETAYIGHYVVIGENCVVGDNTVIQSHTKLDDNVEVGKDCFIDSHVTITGGSKLRDRVRIHSSTVIGGEGFGFAPYQGKWHRIAQLGSVLIGNDVRIDQIVVLIEAHLIIQFWKMGLLLITLCKLHITSILVQILLLQRSAVLLEVQKLAKTVF